MKVFLSFFFTLSFIAIVGSFSLVVYTFYNYFYIKPVPATTIVHDYVQPDLDDRKLWSLIQEWRKSEGLKEYSEDNLLCNLSKSRLVEIQDNYEHRLFTQKDYSSMKTNELSENINLAFSEEQTLDSWLKSASHSSALKRNYVRSCLRCENEYCVQLFAR